MADRADRAARRRGKSAETTSPDDSDGSTSDEGEPSELPMCTTHEKVHLEVTDSQHRYAKHLRMYHREWESRGSVGSFWDWIDAEPLVTMPDCPRERLQECRVAYLHLPEERAPYIVEVHQGRFYHPENPGTGEERSPYSTGEGEWIFVFSSARVSHALSLACQNQSTSSTPCPTRLRGRPSAYSPRRCCSATARHEAPSTTRPSSRAGRASPPAPSSSATACWRSSTRTRATTGPASTTCTSCSPASTVRRASRQCPGSGSGSGSCASSGRAWRLWAARHSQRERPAHWAPSHGLGCSSEPPPKPPMSPPLALQVHLRSCGVSLASVSVDVQRVYKVRRSR